MQSIMKENRWKHRWKMLHYLNLHSNNICNLDRHVLDQFQNLVNLDISSNQISVIQHLEVLPQLKYLNLSNNQVRQSTIPILHDDVLD